MTHDESAGRKPAYRFVTGEFLNRHSAAAEATLHLDLDGAWDEDTLGLPRREARGWGPWLRCFGRRAEVEAFYLEACRDLPPFVLYGSGDYHYLTALLVRRTRDALG